MRIHITGASGSGTTTLGAALARSLGSLHLDADGFFWVATDPPFRTKRVPAERGAMLQAAIDSAPHVVVSGSLGGWGPDIEDCFNLIVFLYLPTAVRLERLRRRENERYGFADPDFLEWASQYDEGPPEGRSLAKHNAWLARRKCPVLRLEQDYSVQERLAQVLETLKNVSK